LFTIAQDLTKMQVYAKTDESDVGQIRAGQKVVFKVDAYPRDSFSGTVSQVRMNSTIVQNVVTYDTIIDFDNPDLKLFPGMTAYVTIPVAAATGVLKVPNGALRYKPDLPAEEITALYQKYGIPESGASRRQDTSSTASGVVDAAAKPPGGAAPHHNKGASGATSENHGSKLDTQIVWKLLPDSTMEPVRIKTGITDHTFTELVQELNGHLGDGDELITGVAQGRGQAGGPRVGGPGVPRGR
jgi:HlyD family secretion protein